MPPPNTPDDGDAPSLAEDQEQSLREQLESGVYAVSELDRLPYYEVFLQEGALGSRPQSQRRNAVASAPQSQPATRNTLDIVDTRLEIEQWSEIGAVPPHALLISPSNDYMVQEIDDEKTDETKIDWQALTYKVDADAELLCPICQSPFWQPVVTKCGHTFCTSCLVTHIETQASRAGTSCAVCRTPFFVKFNTDLLGKDKLRRLLTVISDPSPRIITNMLDKLVVECPNLQGRCSWVGPRSLVEKHVAVDCDYTLVNCAEKRCGQKLIRKAAMGRSGCQHYTVFCHCCQKSMTRAEQSQHLENDCPEFPLPCISCLQSVRRKDMAKHEDACWNEVATCSFRDTGCSMQGSRREAHEHEKSCVYGHVHELEQRVNTKMAVVDTLQRECQRTELNMQLMAQRMAVIEENNERVKVFLQFVSGVLDVRNEARRDGLPGGAQSLEHYIELDGRINDLAQTMANQDQHHAMALNMEIGRLRQENLDFRRQFSAVTNAMRRLTHELPGRGSFRNFTAGEQLGNSSNGNSTNGSDGARTVALHAGDSERLTSRQSISSEPRPSL